MIENRPSGRTLTDPACSSVTRLDCEKAGVRVFVAICDGSVIGFVDAALVRHDDRGTYHAPGLDAFVEELTVTSAARREGVGTSLM